MKDSHKCKNWVIEIADFLLENPNAERAEILRIFGKKCRKSERTVDRHLQQARKYNKERLQAQEAAKTALLVEKAKQDFEKTIATREEIMQQVTKIVRGETRSIDGETLVPTFADILRAAGFFADINGWYAPKKVDAKLQIPQDTKITMLI